MKLIPLFFMMIISSYAYAQPPYSGTVWVDGDIITPLDTSRIISTTYTGQAMSIMYDERVPGNVTVNAFQFDVLWNDSLACVIQVNPEFLTVAAATFEAERYAFILGQIPSCLRVSLNKVWIHKGNENWAAQPGNSIMIYTDNFTSYQPNVEEVLIHEGAHVSLQGYQNSSSWLNAQNQDPTFISTYAQDNPTTEDIAESYILWLAVRYRSDRISMADSIIIEQTIPNRITFLDSINCHFSSVFDLCPIAIGSSGTGSDYINYVALNGVSNPSSQDYYGDFTNINIELFSDSTYTLQTDLFYAFPPDTARAWIDYNNNKVFESFEAINMSAFNSFSESFGTFTVPQQVSVGDTVTLRIRAAYGTDPIPCGVASGEVEDYSIILRSIINSGNNLISEDFKNKPVLFPNPTTGKVNIKLDNLREVTLRVRSIDGQLIYSKENINEAVHVFDIKETAAGVYVVEVEAKEGKMHYKLIKH